MFTYHYNQRWRQNFRGARARDAKLRIQVNDTNRRIAWAHNDELMTGRVSLLGFDLYQPSTSIFLDYRIARIASHSEPIECGQYA